MEQRNGFTLIELIVATSMLAMLAGASYAALSTGTRAAAKVKRYNNMIAHGQAALQAIAYDVRAAVIHEDFVLTALDRANEDVPTDTIDFIAAGKPRLQYQEPTSGRYEVGYYIENDPDTDFQWLVRREDATLDMDGLEGGAITLVGPYVNSLNLSFYDGIQWYTSWEQSETLPELVYVEIVVTDEYEIENPIPFSTSIPIMASGVTSTSSVVTSL